jgi:anti-anti-sigma factor
MATPQGVVRVHPAGEAITFLVEGKATMTQSASFRRCAERFLAGGGRAVRVDLRHCTYMDSTFVGTLLCLKRDIDRRKQGELALVCPSPPCGELLRQMGLHAILPVVTADEPAAGDWTELPNGCEDVQTFKNTVTQAHQELAALPGPAGEVFNKVARSIAQAERDPDAPAKG